MEIVVFLSENSIRKKQTEAAVIKKKKTYVTETAFTVVAFFFVE